MCGTLFEIIFLIAGIILIVTGKIPNKLFSILFGKGLYDTTSTNVRLFGLLLASPFPVVFVVSFIIGLLFGKDSLGYVIFFETGYFIIVILASIIIARKIRQSEIVS